MSTTHVRSVGVAVESTFGQISSTTGLPDVSGVTWANLECDRASIETFGDPAIVERNEARDGVHTLPPHLDSMWDSTNSRWFPRRTGTITLTCSLRPMGSASALAGWEAAPMGMLLDSGMGRLDPGAATDVVTAEVDESSWTPTTAANFVDGGIVSAIFSGRAEYAGVTDSASDISVSPEFSDPPAASPPQTIYLMPTWYDKLGTDTGESGGQSSVSLRLDGDGWLGYAVGCRMESVRWYGDGRVQKLDITMSSQMVFSDNANAAASSYEPDRTNGKVQTTRGSYAVLTGSIAAGVPVTRAVYCTETWEATITNTLASVGCSNSAIGMADMEVTDTVVEVTTTLSQPTTPDAATHAAKFDYSLWSQTSHSLMLGTAPTGESEGAALYIPAAHLTNDGGTRDLGGDIVMQTLTWSAGRWSNDTAGDATANTPIRLAIGGKI